MRISARCDYACKALLALSTHWPKKEPLHINSISTGQKIPVRYLVQILIQLKRIGLVTSLRGKAGGYVLSRDPRDVILGDVIRRIQGPFIQTSKGMAGSKKDPVFGAIWRDVESAMAGVLDRISLEDIRQQADKLDKAIVYQI